MQTCGKSNKKLSISLWLASLCNVEVCGENNNNKIVRTLGNKIQYFMFEKVRSNVATFFLFSLLLKSQRGMRKLNGKWKSTTMGVIK